LHRGRVIPGLFAVDGSDWRYPLARAIVTTMQGFKPTAQGGEEMRHLIAVRILAIERALACRSAIW
jgi:hypothetical protein